MKRFLCIITVSLTTIGSVNAEDEITIRSREKPVTGVIKVESPRGVSLEKGKLKDTFSSEDIVDIFYDLPKTPDVKFGAYSGARKEEKDSLDPTKEAKRKVHLQAAIDKYKEAHDKAKDAFPQRHMLFKIAMLQVRQTQEEGAPPEPALKALTDFKAKHAGGWQIVPVVQTLAQMHLARGEYKEASAAYEELAGLDISDEAKVDAQVQAASVSIREMKHDEALKRLQGLIAKLPKGSRLAARAEVAIGECLIAQNKMDAAVGMLRGIIKGTTDKGVKAAAYNALGEGYFKKGDFKEARWEFLWVDVIYNQDRMEHARALYHLAKTFDALGEGDRALECLETLATDRQFSGLEYQRLAQTDLAGDKKKK